MTTIAIDIGHGSDTFPPSKGVYKNGKAYHEHDFNSRVAVKLDKILRDHGFNTIMYQKPYSREVSLTSRTNYYNSKGVDLVWSIHANAGTSSVEGRCAFYWHTSSAGRRLAEIFIDEVRKAGYSTHGNGLHASMHGSWTNLHIVRETNAPAVLTENGFMTNSKDFELIFGSRKDEYAEDMAIVHAKAICRYFGVKFKGNNEGKLTLSQYNELKGLIDSLENKVASLERENSALRSELSGKLNKPSDNQSPNPSHEESTDWAKDNGISSGINPRHFLTREQSFTMLKAYDEMRFKTGGEPQPSHEESWAWAVENGLTVGTNPRMYPTREQLTTMLKKFEEMLDELDKNCDCK